MDVSAYGGLTVSIDGRLVSGPEAAVSVWDHGFLYGDGCFEGLRLFAGRLFRYPDHYERLQRSMRILDLRPAPGDDGAADPAFTRQAIYRQICRVIAANALADAHVRVIVTRGAGAPGIDPYTCDRPSLIVMAYPMPPMLGTDPIELMVSSVVRKAPGSIDPHVKSLNYLDSVLAKSQAAAAGAHDAIMLDSSRTVSEATGANLFLVDRGVLRTPTTRSVLPGVTRRAVLEFARDQDIPAVEGDVTVGEVYAADECFLTGSGAGIVPVGRVDGRSLGGAPGPVTRLMRTLYADATRDARWTVPAEGSHRFDD